MMTFLFLIAISLCAGAGLWSTYQLIQARVTIQSLLEELANVHSANPWKSQLMLMLKSSQVVPMSPSINKGTMLYGALILEEGGETLLALAEATESASMGHNSDLFKIANDFAKIAAAMRLQSVAIRSAIASTMEDPTGRLMSKEQARALLDGVTDLHVVTAGLGISAGLPGQAGYDRVATSNLSKANPVTGVIDKDPSGKWIKGPEYHEPDLDSLLSPYYNQSRQA